MILVKLTGGLANRMRVIDSCYWLGKKTNKQVRILWEKSFELNCGFKEIFVLPADIAYEEYQASRSRIFIQKRWNRLMRTMGFQQPPGFDLYLYQEEIDQKMEQGYDFEQIKNYHKVFVNTHSHFYRTDHSFQLFRPLPEIQAIVDQYRSAFSNRTIGVHIRRTDNAMSTQFSPLSGFLEYMEGEIALEPQTMFFLATDAPEVEGQIRGVFGEKVVTHPKVLDRNTAQGIKDAVVDMYCLAACQKIIGSYYSSFSEVAAQINGIELNQIYEKV